MLEMIPSNYMIPFWLWIDVHFMYARPKIDFIPNENGRKSRATLSSYTDSHICFIIIWNKNVVFVVFAVQIAAVDSNNFYDFHR